MISPKVLSPAPTLRRWKSRATLSRSWSLLRSFPDEQRNPDRFYTQLAQDTAHLVEDIYGAATGNTLESLSILDVGGGPGYFTPAFAAIGARYFSVEPDAGEMAGAGLSNFGSVRGSGMALPIRDDAVEICMSSNVAEHVPHPWRMAEEMVRVTKPGGIVILSYTLWWGPFGGHEMGMTHYLGGHRAARMYQQKHGKRPKNFYGESLFKVGCAEGLKWAQSTPTAEFLAAFPRYHPWWAWWMTKVPILREVAVSNLVIVLRPR